MTTLVVFPVLLLLLLQIQFLPFHDKANLPDSGVFKRGRDKEHLFNLRGRHLEKAALDGADLTKADLTGARLQGASLNYAQLQGALLIVARLQDASLSYAQLQGASLNAAELQGASLVELHPPSMVETS